MKALRLYEQRGLIDPLRTSAGWRTYGPKDMATAGKIVAFRKLGLSLAQVKRVLGGESEGLASALAEHQAGLEGQAERLAATIDRVRAMRGDIERGQSPSAGELQRVVNSASARRVAFDLPWPWGGERFDLDNIRPLTFITGPLGSGKTRFAHKIAKALPDAQFVDLERSTLDGDGRTDAAMAWLVEDGASETEALQNLIAILETAAVLVIDLVEQGLDEATQEALMRYLRRRKRETHPVFLLTRSSSILDLAAVGPDETILFCPANHSPPVVVSPYPGSPGFEAVASCLAPPDVRARTEGVIAMRPNTG